MGDDLMHTNNTHLPHFSLGPLLQGSQFKILASRMCKLGPLPLHTNLEQQQDLDPTRSCLVNDGHQNAILKIRNPDFARCLGEHIFVPTYDHQTSTLGISLSVLSFQVAFRTWEANTLLLPE
jgi:hypothetical protein